MQNKIIYQPTKNLQEPDCYGLENMQVHNLATSDNIKITCWHQPPAVSGRPILLYFHGNAANIGDEFRVARYNEFLQLNIGICAVSYRGYGNSQGNPHEQGLYNDARTAIEFLTKEKSYKLNNIIIYGESLGTAVAVQMAGEYQNIHSLILESPYVSMEQLARRNYPWLPVSILLKNQLASYKKLDKIKAPTMILHGHLDELIPVSHGQYLFDNLNDNVRKHGIFHQDAGHVDFTADFLRNSISDFCYLGVRGLSS
ncbi:MAG: alpha/beta hydrolase [Pseudomonadota bacterium]